MQHKKNAIGSLDKGGAATDPVGVLVPFRTINAMNRFPNNVVTIQGLFHGESSCVPQALPDLVSASGRSPTVHDCTN